MVDVPSFSQPYLCIQPLLQSPPKILFSPSVNFYLLVPPYLVHKIILTILTNIRFLSTSLILQLLIVTYNLRNPIYTKSISLLQPLSQFRLRQGTRKLGSLVETDNVLISIFLLPESMGCHNRAQNHVLLITQGQKVGVLQVVLSGEDACNWMANHLIHYLSYPQPIVISSIPY